MAAQQPVHSDTESMRPIQLPVWPNQENLVAGYPALAGKMGQIPQLCNLRGFWALAMRDLLYRQAELTHIERDLVQQEIRDRDSERDERRDFAGDYEQLSSAIGNKSNQWRKIEEMRTKLKDYCIPQFKASNAFLSILRI